MSQPDYRRIHELEYELGYRDDPPPLPRLEITDMPGAVIEYDPTLWRPPTTAERRIAVAREIAERYGF